MSTLEMVSLVLPCRNQADHIGAILPRYVTALESLRAPFELVVVPNASTDSTQEVVEELARAEPRIRVVCNPQGGWGLSVRTGLDAASGMVLAYTNTARTAPESVAHFVRVYCARGGQYLVKARRQARQAGSWKVHGPRKNTWPVLPAFTSASEEIRCIGIIGNTTTRSILTT